MVIFGATLIISGIAFLVGAVCAAIWGPPGGDQIDLYWMAGALVLLGVASIVAVRRPIRHKAGLQPRVQPSEPTATNGTSMSAAPDPTPLLRELIGLAEVQLAESWAVTRDQNTYALALSALGVAIMGVIVTAQSVLGSDWWVPLPGLATASVVAILGTRQANSELGPDPAAFYAAFGEASTKEALAYLLADVLQAQGEVPKTLRRQRIALLVVAVIFVATAVYSTLLLV
jgi:hypothetical protein